MPTRGGTLCDHPGLRWLLVGAALSPILAAGAIAQTPAKARDPLGAVPAPALTERDKPRIIGLAEPRANEAPAPVDEATPAITEAAAEPQRGAPPDVTTLVPLDAPLIANGRLLGDISIAVDPEGRGEIDAVRLLQLLRPVIAKTVIDTLETRVAGRLRVNFSELSGDDFQLAYDPASIEVHASFGADALATQSVQMRGIGPPDLSAVREPAHAAGGVTVALDQLIDHEAGERLPLIADLDGFFTLGGFSGTTLWFGGRLREGADDSWDRGQIRLTRDYFKSATQLVAGEFDPQVTGFQDSDGILGLGFARDYARLRPFENVRPSGRRAITLERESTIIVEVNEQEKRRVRLPPGRYELSDLDITNGNNLVRLYVEDLAGRQEIAVFSVFSDQTLLEKGREEFAVSAGWQDKHHDDTYDGPLSATGYYRRGVLDTLTLGAGGQLSPDSAQLSAEASLGVPAGLGRLTLAASDHYGRTGNAVALDWRSYLSVSQPDDLTILASVETRTQGFASPFLPAGYRNTEQARYDARVDWRSENLSLGLSFHQSDLFVGPRAQAAEASMSYSFGPVSVFAAAGVEDRLGRQDSYGNIGLYVRFTERTSARARYETRGLKPRSVEVERYRKEEIGDLSGRMVYTEDSARKTVTAEGYYINNRFDAAIETSTTEDRTGAFQDRSGTRLRLASFVGFADGAFGIGRPARSGFLLLPQHRSIEGSTVKVHDEAGLVVGQSGWFGPALVPLQRGYFQNTYEVEAEHLPEGYDLGDPLLPVFPAAASGYRLPVGSDDFHMALGYLITREGPLAEVGGVVESKDNKTFEPRPFFTNAAGRFAADRLAPGRYQLRVGDRIVGEFSIPDTKEGMINVGRLEVDVD